MSSFLSDISLFELVLIGCCAVVTSIVGGVAGYGTGALMPLVLVPIVGAEPVVPIIALSAMFTNTARVIAFRRLLDPRRAAIALICASPTCVLGAWLYTLLNGRGAAIVIGCTMMASVPLRRTFKSRGFALGERGLAVGSVGWGIVVGGTSGAGIILLSLLMASGLEGAAVIATDAAVSIGIGFVKVAVFGLAGVVTPKVAAIAVLIGCIGFPGTFVAKLIVERMPVHLHTALLDAVVILGGAIMIFGAFR